MANLFVSQNKNNPQKGVLFVSEADLKIKCALGREGLSTNKQEGDGKTPIGRFRIRNILVRSDLISLQACKLEIIEITKNHIWCDDATSEHYNKLLVLEEAKRVFSHELIYRDDHKYDIILPLGYNDEPAIQNKGSAIFLHLASNNYEPTQGCVAIAQNDMLKIIPLLDENSYMEIAISHNS